MWLSLQQVARQLFRISPELIETILSPAIDAIVRWNELEVGERVMVLGAGLVGYEVAWFAAQQGRDVVLVSRRNEEDVIKLKEHGTNLAALRKGVRDSGVRILASRELKRVDETGVVLDHKRWNGGVPFH